jgi:predicted PurR-regulated permease PerM
MVNRTRLKAMIKLAEYESGEGKKALEIRKYYRSDYIALDLIKTFFLTTIGYILLIGLVGAFNLNYLVDHIDRMDIRVLLTWLIVGYAVILVIYLSISFFRSSARYRNARRSVRGYEEELENLEQLYRRKKT